MTQKLKVKKIDEKALIPEYAYESDVALDIRSIETVTIKPFEQKEIKTGIAIEIPDNHVGIIRDRVGIVTKIGCHVIAGTFSSTYRGEITIFMVNYTNTEVQIEEEMKVAQIVILPVAKLPVEEVENLSETERSLKNK